MTLKDKPPRSEGVQYTIEEEKRNCPRRMKRLIQSRNNAKLWMCLVVRLKSDAVKDSSALELGMLHP